MRTVSYKKVLAWFCVAIGALIIIGNLAEKGKPPESTPTSSDSKLSNVASAHLEQGLTRPSDKVYRDGHFVDPSPKDSLIRLVQLSGRYRIEADVVLLADFTIKNTTEHSFKDFEITCKEFGPSGTLIDSNIRTVYEVVEAHATHKVNHFNMGFVHSQTARLQCEITDLVPMG
jgi:hypothetical protein